MMKLKRFLLDNNRSELDDSSISSISLGLVLTDDSSHTSHATVTSQRHTPVALHSAADEIATSCEEL